MFRELIIMSYGMSNKYQIFLEKKNEILWIMSVDVIKFVCIIG